MRGEPDSDSYEYYIVHDGLGISHVIRRKKGVPGTFCRYREKSSAASTGEVSTVLIPGIVFRIRETFLVTEGSFRVTGFESTIETSHLAPNALLTLFAI